MSHKNQNSNRAKPTSGTSKIALIVLLFSLAAGGFLIFNVQRPVDIVPSVGGPFELVDHTGAKRTDADFLGSYMLIYFGYTHCPDVCPVSLELVSEAMSLMTPSKSARIVPILISVDPERDTPEQMAEYVTFFHPRTVGLTGSAEDIIGVAKDFRVYAKKSGEGEDYLMDHTSLLYLMGPDGGFVATLPLSEEPESLARKLNDLILSKQGA